MQIVHNGIPGALYEVGDDYEAAKELLVKVLVKNNVKITDEVQECIDGDGYYDDDDFGYYIVSSELFSEDDSEEADEEDDGEFSVYDGTVYHEDHGEESLGEFTDGRFVPSKYLLELPAEFHKDTNAFATQYLEDQEEEDRRDHKRGLYGDEG